MGGFVFEIFFLRTYLDGFDRVCGWLVGWSVGRSGSVVAW